MPAFDAPQEDAVPVYARDVALASSVADLGAVWAKWSAGLDNATRGMLSNALEVRKLELEQGPPKTTVVSSMTKLEQIELDTYQAVLAYGDALDRFAKGHTEFKTLRAKAYLRFKTTEVPGRGGKMEPMANAEADQQADADETVAAARLEAYISEGLVKAAKANLDRLEQSFQYHRSLMVNERKMDQRPS